MNFVTFASFSVDDIVLFGRVRNCLEEVLYSFYDMEGKKLLEKTFILLEKFLFPGSQMSFEDIRFSQECIHIFVQEFSQRLQRDYGVVFFPSLDDPRCVFFPISLTSTFDQVITMVFNRINFSLSLPPITENEDGSLNGVINTPFPN